MHEPIAFYFFFVGIFLACAWCFADSIDTLRHREGNSLWKLVAAGLMVVWCPILMLIMILAASFGIARGLF